MVTDDSSDQRFFFIKCNTIEKRASSSKTLFIQTMQRLNYTALALSTQQMRPDEPINTVSVLSGTSAAGTTLYISYSNINTHARMMYYFGNMMIKGITRVKKPLSSQRHISTRKTRIHPQTKTADICCGDN